MVVTTTLAYYDTAVITAIKSFRIQFYTDSMSMARRKP
jgi:hypothetical protein